ncbi:MAG: hypothetical protein AAGA48_25980 [Myxococcota bacterium]
MNEDDKKRVVRDFLVRCRAWGTDLEIPKLLGRLNEEANPGDAAKLHQWTSWVAFVDHAIHEVDHGELDDWFREGEAAGYRTDGSGDRD